MLYRRTLSIATAAVLLAGCGGPQPPGAMLQAQRAHNSTSGYGYCPAYRFGTGILPDGDFSQQGNPGHGLVEPSKGIVFAPHWEVAKRNIDFVGNGFWDMDGLCSVDLDGTAAGGIKTSVFATKSGTSYKVTFLMSGNGCEGSGGGHCLPEKSMRVEAAGQFQPFTWNTQNDNDAEHGVYAPETWRFLAINARTVLSFTSEDEKSSGRGCVVAAIAVTKRK